MTKEELIRMAREAGFDQTGLASFEEFTARIERFAALVVEHEIYQIGQGRITLTGHLKHLLDHVMAVAAQREREACAQLVVDLDGGLEWVAKEIRERGTK